MKILHLSDLHLCGNYKRANIVKTKRMLKYFVDNNFDHLVITGDISDNSNINDWKLLKKMLVALGIYDNRKVTVVIGNHDIFGGVQTALDILSFPKRCSLTDYDKKVNDFVEVFSELHSENLTLNHKHYPFVKIVENIAFVTFNSIDGYGRFTNPFASNGKIPILDQTNVLKLFANDLLVDKQIVALTHHHFYKNNCEATSSSSGIWNNIEKFTMKLRGKKRLLKLFNTLNVKLVLHGHSHENKQYERKDIIFVNAGGSIDNLSNNESTAVIIDTNDLSVNMESVFLNSKNSLSIKYQHEYILESASVV